MNKTYEEIDAFKVWNLDLRIVERRGANPHCEDGPAYTHHRVDGSIERDIWFRDGKRHRDDGPASIGYVSGNVYPGYTRTFEELEEAGLLSSRGWWLNDRRTMRFT